MNQPLDQVNDKTFERVLKLVQEIGVYERHFNSLQANCRGIASAWLLATFGALGFCLTEKISIGVSIKLLVCSIASSGAIGILLLWILDLQVYHRLLDSCFIEALCLEETYSWLPRLRGRMMKSQEGRGVLSKIVIFYLVPIASLIFVAVYTLSSWVHEELGFRGAVPVVLAGVIMDVAVCLYILRKTLNTNKLRRNLLQ
jgi:hypothetical protein